nr:MAG TPA: hypothetical protein [Caudoviricetes sp.]
MQNGYNLPVVYSVSFRQGFLSVIPGFTEMKI